MKTRKLTVIAQDPSVENPDGDILRTRVTIPDEQLGPGPRGYRINVIDYDSSQRVLYHPFKIPKDSDPFEKASDSSLLEDPGFHAQNVYAIIMRLLFRFEEALGRRISWGFGGQQLNVVPHAFADANAFYSEDYQGLFFGYFPGSHGNNVYTCLSHDIIVHEATHALLDGLRETYTVPSYPDQAGFHEGFADIVALLSIFGLREVVKSLLSKKRPGKEFINRAELEAKILRKSILLGLAEQFGEEVNQNRADCLRRAVTRKPKKDALKDPAFEESHIRGEILSAAVLNSFIDVWIARLKSWWPRQDKVVPIEKVIEDADDAATHLLKICIRALDYCPVVDINFSDFLSSLLTADRELLPDDGKYNYRQILLKQFGSWHIDPASGNEKQFQAGSVPELGVWPRFKAKLPLNYDCVHRESLEKDRNEVFRFLWENRNSLGIFEDAYTWIISLRPCIRTAPDGFILKETACEYRQTIELKASQLKDVSKDLKKPEGMRGNTPLRLNGGGVLIFDEFGRLKYHIPSRINDPKKQNERLEYLWKNKIKDTQGRYGFSDGSPKGQRFAQMHNRRNKRIKQREEWPND